MPYRIWNKKKIIKGLQEITKLINRTPTERHFKESGKYSLLSAAKRYFGSYTNALIAANLKPNLQFWSKEKIILEFKQIVENIGYIPTYRNLIKFKRHDILSAIRRHYNNQYNKVVRDSGFEPNNIRWNKDKVKQKILSLAEAVGHTPTEREIRFHACDLFGGAIRVFGSLNEAIKYAGLKPNQSFVQNNLWKFWEHFVILVAKKTYDSKALVHYKLPNGKIPDVFVNNEKIIEAKLNISSEKILEDVKKYKDYANNIEFWHLYGVPTFSATNVRFIGPGEIEKTLKKIGEKSLLSDLCLLKKGINPKDITKLNNIGVNKNVGCK